MNRTIITLYTFTLSILACYSTQAQDAKATEILNALSKKMQSYSSYRAGFSLNIKAENEKLDETTKGTITIKGNKFLLQTAEQDIYNDHKTVWTHAKADKEVTITNNDPSDPEMNPASIYTLYKKGFKSLFIESKTVGSSKMDVVDLTPDNKGLEYFKIRMTIDSQTKQLKSWQIFNKNGRKYLFTITKFEPNVAADDALFKYNAAANKGVEVVDLR
ncbi:MAG: outer membrane lipoprotein carrier protein LolA [Cytophagales bacterium]|nr:MAG: outer membrane lipoprotein carrier protein LolA [Cytophagales bacterium]